MEQHLGFPWETMVIFSTVVVSFVWLDLWMYRDKEDISISGAIVWSIFWIFLSIGFYFYLRIHHNAEYAGLFLSGYFLEESLSVDNLMVFVAIFASFGITGILQHRILYFGILGAVIFRLIFIIFGTQLFSLGTWVEFFFAAIVAWTGWTMLTSLGANREIEDYSHHWSVIFTQKLLPIFPRLCGHRFFVSRGYVQDMVQLNANFHITRDAVLYATPMLLCLVVIEVSDIIFAFDSIPAVIAVTREPLLVYSAVIFAILGLRSLYFVLAAAQKYLVHLGKSVAALLFFISFKLGLQASNHLFSWPSIQISTDFSLIIILSTLTIGVIISLLFPTWGCNKESKKQK
jgi:tellurite resistance protein TerC